MKQIAAGSIPTVMGVAVFCLAHCAGTPVEPAQGALAGSDLCATCHEQEARFCQYGAHREISCEECHGPGAEHARAEGPSRPGMTLADAELCLSCHRKGATRSADVASTVGSFEAHLQALERDHRVKLDRQKSGTDCVYCHDPHLLE